VIGMILRRHFLSRQFLSACSVNSVNNIHNILGQFILRSSSSNMSPTSGASSSSSSNMSSSRTYEEAIKALNNLQTNAALLDKVRRERQKNVHLNLPLTAKYLERSGMTLEDLDSIKVIHVSGTKGKGSTCAFTESILRWHGLKTGFYSSPHLVSAVERIRIRGRPISRDNFAKYFWLVYDSVCKDRPHDDRPPYFKFLTILAFNIFWREGVDVAIIEVGIGGSYDCTNIIRKPVVAGITALGLDHTSLLGNSISDIAWHKSGIMKQGVQTFIDGNQQDEALRVLHDRSIELDSNLAKVPHLLGYDWGIFPICLGLYGAVQHNNASLAVALSQYFLDYTRRKELPRSGPDPDGGDISLLHPLRISPESALGLRVAHWPGRSQTIDRGRVVYFLDGAHTEESIWACKNWFTMSSKISAPQGSIFKVLLFNMTGDRDSRSLLAPLSSLGIDLVVFCTNMSSLTSTADQTNHTTSEKAQLARCQDLLHTWVKIQAEQFRTRLVVSGSKGSDDSMPGIGMDNAVPAVVVPCINDALLWMTQGRDSQLNSEYSVIPDMAVPRDLVEAEQVQVLVTGSLHLVGGVLACVQPGMEEPRVAREMVQSYLSPRQHSIPGMM